MTEYDDEISGSEDIRSFDNASSAVRRFGQSQEYLDILFNPALRDVPIHGDEDNGTGFRKLFGAVTGTSTVTPVRRVATRVTLRDPLESFEKLMDTSHGQHEGMVKTDRGWMTPPEFANAVADEIRSFDVGRSLAKRDGSCSKCGFLNMGKLEFCAGCGYNQNL